MSPRIRTIELLLLAALAVLLLAGIQLWGIREVERDDAPAMRDAYALATRWFAVVEEAKREGGIERDPHATGRYAGMLGTEYSAVTTTLGSVEAKRAAANPAFAAAMVRQLHEAGVDPSSTIGITLSGSFPSLAIATLAAAQTIGARVVMISSLGASSYGANQPGATWIDIEGWLQKRGGLRYASLLVTAGAEGDSGGGLESEGLSMLHSAARRNGVGLQAPGSLQASIGMRLDALLASRCCLLVNIGGSQAVMGSCAHAESVPNGYHRSLVSCGDEDRGLLVRATERGIPVIHLLNVKDLAVRWGVPLVPEGSSADVRDVYTRATVDRGPVAGALLGLIGLVAAASFCRRSGRTDATSMSAC